MKAIVCYSMRALVGSFMPRECEVVFVETLEECFHVSQIHPPDAVILFSEALSPPVWEWLPRLHEHFPPEVKKIIVPLERDVQLIARIAETSELAHTYILPSGLSYEEIHRHLQRILLPSEFTCQLPGEEDAQGKIITLTSYGGAGVSTFLINYPVLFAKQFRRTRIAVIDMNVEKPDLTDFFQLSTCQLALFRSELVTRQTAVRRDWTKVFKPSESTSNLFYASGAAHWKGYELSTLLSICRAHFHYVFIDWGFCFPRSEAMYKLFLESDAILYFMRPDSLSFRNRWRWIDDWPQISGKIRVIVSHCDNDIRFIGRMSGINGYPCEMIPLLPPGRLTQSLISKSILVEELFPPKAYTKRLTAIGKEMKNWEGVAIRDEAGSPSLVGPTVIQC